MKVITSSICRSVHMYSDGGSVASTQMIQIKNGLNYSWESVVIFKLLILSVHHKRLIEQLYIRSN